MTELAAPETTGSIHETAIVHREAEIPASAVVGPYSIIGPGVVIGERVRIDSHVLIERDTTVGEDCRICKGAVLGTDPQDLKYAGEPTTLTVGARTTVREYATLNRGTVDEGTTAVGSDCLIMAYAHVSHDSRIGDHVILANSANMGGHVIIEDWAIVGGVTAIHQFVRIGRHSFVGGGSRLPQDVVPYVMVAGSPCAAFGLNLVGLRRRGFDRDTLRRLREAYRTIFQSDMNVSQAVEALSAREDRSPEVDQMIEFIRSSERGITM
jgi:UDP-N-acetylglucosamine acyltransferase